MPTLIQTRRGPYSFLSSFLVLSEGEPYEAGLAVPDGSTFETLWLGGHDGVNKLIGPGFQLTTGQPQFAAPVGAALWDTATAILWVSNNASQVSWQQVASNSSVSPPSPPFAWPSIGTVDGGTWI